jgi:nucleotide-binding universal stress UspA family protein
MRVLLAYDDSPCARVALELTAGVGWPAGTSIEVVQVVEPRRDLVGLPDAAFLSASDPPPTDEAVLEAAHRAVEGAATRLRAAGHPASGRVRNGRPATVLARDAERGNVDLLIVGSRGHGPMDALLLGSVSTELVDHAPCPVLVVRGPRIDRAVVASDGSASSSHAIGQLVEWGLLQGAEARVVSVAPGGRPLGGLLGVVEPRVADLEHGADEELLRFHRSIAEDAARQLTRAGVRAEPELRRGDAAHEIVRAAEACHADLVVTGSRGLGTLPRLLLGSVARKVLLHAGRSVLVMRPHPERPEQRVRFAVPQTAVGLGAV